MEVYLRHDTHADVIAIQETKLTPKANTPKVHNFTTVRTQVAQGRGWVVVVDSHFHACLEVSFHTLK